MRSGSRSGWAGAATGSASRQRAPERPLRRACRVGGQSPTGAVLRHEGTPCNRVRRLSAGCDALKGAEPTTGFGHCERREAGSGGNNEQNLSGYPNPACNRRNLFKMMEAQRESFKTQVSVRRDKQLEDGAGTLRLSSHTLLPDLGG